MKKVFMLVVLLTVMSSAGMIEWQATDRVQWLTFEDCNPDSIAQVVVGFSMNLDSGYVHTMHQLTDSVDFSGRNVMNPDRDSLGHAIPGHYYGEYWWYVDCITWWGDTLWATDINHVVVDYVIPQPCGGTFWGATRVN